MISGKPPLSCHLAVLCDDFDALVVVQRPDPDGAVAGSADDFMRVELQAEDRALVPGQGTPGLGMRRGKAPDLEGYRG